MKVTTVLLDAGGVILDESEQDSERIRVAIEVLSPAVPGYSPSAIATDLGEAIELFCPRVFAYVFWKHLRPDRAKYDSLYAAFSEEWRRRRPPLVVAYGIDEELRAISRDFDIGIAGQYGRELLTVLEGENLLGYFKHRFTQDDFTITKPDPRYFEGICEACEVDPRGCVVVGDRIDNDIIPAKQLGMKTVLVRVGMHKHQQARTPFEIGDAELAGIEGLAGVLSRIARQA